MRAVSEAANSTVMAIAGHVSREKPERYTVKIELEPFNGDFSASPSIVSAHPGYAGSNPGVGDLFRAPTDCKKHYLEGPPEELLGTGSQSWLREKLSPLRAGAG